jgi:hypothetical protein
MVGVSALAFAAAQAAGSAAEAKEPKQKLTANKGTGELGAGHHRGINECSKACSACQLECDSCAHHCGVLMSEGHKDHVATLRSCLDCADICSAAAQIVARQGVFDKLICEPCAEDCAKCAAECEKHASDPIMADCAKACRACEKACKEMVQA